MARKKPKQTKVEENPKEETKEASSIEIKRDARGLFLKGYSANPGGKKEKKLRVRHWCEEHIDRIIHEFEMMLFGDNTPIPVKWDMIKNIIQMLEGKPKSVHVIESRELPKDVKHLTKEELNEELKRTEIDLRDEFDRLKSEIIEANFVEIVDRERTNAS